MAKKQTLKSLLGVSDNRVQVEYKGVTEAVTPAVIPSAGTTPYVQDTPKTNALLEVVDAMNKAPQLYATQIGIAQTEAAEAISKLTDFEIAQELAENDDATMSIFGYNKAYNEGLVKRHYKVNAKAYETELNTLASNLSEYPDEADFNAALEAKVEEIKQNNAAQFGRNRFQAGANDEAFQEVIGEYVANASGNYLANKQEAVITGYNTDWLEDIRAGVDTKTAFDTYRENLKTLPITNTKKGELLLEQMEAGYNILRENGEFTKAEKLLDDAEKYEVVKGGKLGAGKNSNTFRRLRDDLERQSATKNEVTVSRIVQQATGQYNRVSNDIMFGESNTEDIKQLITILRPNLDEENIKLLIKDVTDQETKVERINVLNNMITDLGRFSYNGTDGVLTPSDITVEVTDRLGSVTSQFEQDVRTKPPELWSGLSEEQKGDLAIIAEGGYFERNDVAPQRFMLDQGYPNVRPPEAVLNAYREARKLDFVNDIPAVKQLSDTMMKITNTVIKRTDAYQNAPDGARRELIRSTIASEVQLEKNDLRRRVDVFAAGLTGTTEENEKAIEEFIKTEINDFVEVRALVEEARGIYDTFDTNKTQLDIQTYDPDDGETPTILDTKIESKRTNIDYNYPHINNAAEYVREIARTGTTDLPQFKLTLSGAYITMRNKKDRQALEITQRIYGYDAFDPKAAEDLKITGLTTAEVTLFGSQEELTKRFELYDDILTKLDDDPDTLDEKERKTLDEMASFGIFDDASFKYFFVTQKTNLDNR